MRGLLLARTRSEVDFVVTCGRRLTAIEVKSGRARESRTGMEELARAHRRARKLLVGSGGITIEEFLMRPVEHSVCD